MGAHSISQHFDGAMTPKQVEKEFDRMREQATYEHGHDAYNGSWSTIPSLKFPSVKPFGNSTEAFEYCMEHAQKWEYAIAVKYEDRRTNEKGLTIGGKPIQMTHASCPYSCLGVDYSDVAKPVAFMAGYPDGNLVFTPVDQLTQREWATFKPIVEKLRLCHLEYSQATGAFRNAWNSLMDFTTPADWKIAKAARVAVERLAVKKQRALDAFWKANDRLVAKYSKSEPIDKGPKWLIAGWAAS